VLQYGSELPSKGARGKKKHVSVRIWGTSSVSLHIVTRKRYDINAHTEGTHYILKKKNHGDVPKKTSENKLKTDSIIVNGFCNSEPLAKDNLQGGTKTQKQYRILHSTKREFLIILNLNFLKFAKLRDGSTYYMIVMSSANVDPFG
jgi:hypothetical protein